MFKYWQKIDDLNQTNRLLLTFCAALLGIIILLSVALMKAPNDIRFWLTPAMVANGGIMKADDVPDEYVQGFVATLFPSLYTWSKSGKEEFSTNLAGFHYYFTPSFETLMKDTMHAYQDAGLFNRTQVASLYHFLSAGDVVRLSHNTWEVHLVLRITQKLNSASTMLIADKVVDYHLKIVKVNLSKLHNPFGLAIDGYTQPEHLVSDLLAKKKKGDTHEA